MKRFTEVCRFETKMEARARNRWELAILVFFLTWISHGVSAQNVSWSDSFVMGQAPTSAQCQNWSAFLSQLTNKNFASVTLSGTFDEVGKSITNAADATALAALLSSGTQGTIYSGNQSWTVTICGSGSCGTPSIALSVDGNTSECDCEDRYALRPQAANTNWGGVNSSSCNAPSQTMRLEFNSGVSVQASGPTSLCPGGNVVLTAHAEICSPPYSYFWSNGATTESITVSEAGNYSVTVISSDGCSASSGVTSVTLTDVSVNAGEDVTFCHDPVQLMAEGMSGTGGSIQINKLCLYDAPGGADDCTFKSDLCTEGAELIVSSSFSQSTSASNPVELRLLLYYSPFSLSSTFTFKLNGEEIGSFTEDNPTGICDPSPYGQYPRTIKFTPDQFKRYWSNTEENTITVDVAADANGVYFAGIAAEVVTSNEFYSWSPAAGLSDATGQSPTAAPLETTTYTVTFTNAIGCTATDQVLVTVDCNTTPVAVCSPVAIEADKNCEAVVDAAAFDGGSTSPSGSALNFAVSPKGPYAVGETEITFTVTDADGASNSCTTTVTVKDSTVPSVATPDDLSVANDPGTCSATIDLEQPEASDNCGIESILSDHEGNTYAEGETLVTWTVTDIHGNKQTTTQKVTVRNAAPVINSVEPSASSISIGSPVVLSINYSDNNVTTATVDWGDYSPAQTVTNPETTFDVTHSYAKSGSYSASIMLTDACGKSTFTYQSVVVFNQLGVQVSGGGWYQSMPGAYFKDPRASGKADFSFEAAYSKGSAVPVGHANFDFKAGTIKFRSSELQWLLVNGETASLKGVGKLNGVPGYHILISVVDVPKKYDKDKKDGKDKKDDKDKNKGKDKHKKEHKDKHEDKDEGWDKGSKPDLIRVKLWNPSGSVIYDTQKGASDEAIATTKLGGGSIQIKEQKSGFNEQFESPVASSFGEESSSAYPNPFADWIEVRFNASSRENVIIQVLSLSGNAIFNKVFSVSEDGLYSLDIPEGENLKPGVYILTIKQGKRVEFQRLVRD